MPAVVGKIEAENAKALQGIEASLLKDTANEAKLTALPSKGTSQQELLGRMTVWKTEETSRWNTGKVSGAVYHGGEELTAFLGSVFTMFCLSNPLHPDLFPFVRKMEAEVVAMCVSLFHGSDDACGTMSAGGTESILLAVKAYRDWARETRGITEPEMIVPTTIHAAFDKAAHYFGVKLVQVPVDPVTFELTVDAVRREVTGNTILVAASAPCFPQGIIDPIPALSAFCHSRGIPLHVDCCLGGLLLPFVERLGLPVTIPPYDFRNAGVTSISADTHKYGFAPKGSSVILYSTKAMRRYQYFVAPEWTGGIYATPSFAGSRPGALCACTWAAMVHMGDEGYLQSARAIMKAALAIKEGVQGIQEIKLLGDPMLSVISFASCDEQALNIYKVGEAMGKKGWNLNSLQNPKSIHLCCTFLHRNQAATFLGDLRAAVKNVLQNPDDFNAGEVAIYGMAEAAPDQVLVGDLAKLYVDTLYNAE